MEINNAKLNDVKFNYMKSCDLCPRNCKVNRSEGAIGVCGQTREIRASRAALHYWEEPCISGTNGSGTVFFDGCNLGCIFCQNYEIANRKAASNYVISEERLAEIYLELQEKKANNINLVTPSHYVPQIIHSLELAKNQGLKIPIVYNTSSYEKVDILKQLEGLVDIYLPDFKYMDAEKAWNYSKAKDYPEVAKAAISEMVRQVGRPVFDSSLQTDFCKLEDDATEKKGKENEVGQEPLMKRGVIVRHMVLPLGVKNAKEIIKYLLHTYGDTIYISIMNQYTPSTRANFPREKYPELMRRVTKREYEKVVDYALALGIKNAFIQEGETAKESFIPSFSGEGIFHD